MMSMGLAWLQLAGRTGFSASIVASEMGASLPPPRMSASVASTPGPPALVSTVSRGPLGKGCLPSTSAK